MRKDGATDKIIARLSNKSIDEQALPAITATVHKLMAGKAQTGSSPAGLFAVVADERRAAGKLAVSILDDFVAQNALVNLNQPGISEDAAKALARKEPTSTLSAVVVSMDGVAQTADMVSAPDDWSAAVRAYADTLCAGTGAKCLPAATQYVGWGN